MRGPVFVESFGVRAMSEGTARLVDWLVERRRTAAGFLIDGKAGAGDFRNELIAAGVPARLVRLATPDDVITASSGMLRAIADRDVAHSAQPGLDAQVRVAGKRKIGTAGGFGWGPVTPDGDTTAFDAVTLARHGAATAKKKPTSGRGAVFA